MNATASTAQSRHAQELAEKFSKMTSKQEIEDFMNQTENTFEKLTAWEYLQTF
jgi:plasmid maintenance system killer protein